MNERDKIRRAVDLVSKRAIRFAHGMEDARNCKEYIAQVMDFLGDWSPEWDQSLLDYDGEDTHDMVFHLFQAGMKLMGAFCAT